jgi:hypothetical protein
MPTITAEDCIGKAALILKDEGFDRYTGDELLGWFNDGQREVVTYKPDAYVVTNPLKLAEGTLQEIPGTAVSLIEVVRNMGSDGETPGDHIRLIDKRFLNAQRPSWASDSPSATVRFYMYDDRVPRRFEVYPPQPAANQGYVLVSCAETPPDLGKDAEDTTMLVDDIYANAIVHYIVAKAVSGEPEHTSLAAAHMSMFLQAMGVKEEVEVRDDPNVRKRRA